MEGAVVVINRDGWRGKGGGERARQGHSVRGTHARALMLKVTKLDV